MDLGLGLGSGLQIAKPSAFCEEGAQVWCGDAVRQQEGAEGGAPWGVWAFGAVRGA